jgi:hypothetical protein
MDAIEIILTNNSYGQPVYGYNINDTAIFNPHYSQCLRFAADPFKDYGLLPFQVKALHDLNMAHGFDDEVEA